LTNERARALKTAMVKCLAPSGIIPRLAAFWWASGLAN
jgi:hypothetical protein